MHRPTTLLAAVTAVAVLAHARLARSDEPRVRPVREAIELKTAGCVDRDALAAEVAGWIKSDSADRRISVVVEGDPSSEVSFSLAHDGAVVGRRSFHTRGVTCPNVTALLGLAIAMAFDATPLTVLESTPPAGTPAGSPAVAPALTPALARAPSPPAPIAVPAPAPSPPFVLADLELSTLLGVLPRPAAAGAISVSLAVGKHAWIRAATFESTTAGAPLGPGRFDASVAAGDVGACLSAGTRAALWRACGGAAFGRFVATGSGYDVPVTTTLPWVALTARLELFLHVYGPFDLAMSAGQLLPLPSPPRLDVKRGGPADVTLAATTLPAAGFSLGFGPAFRFP